tara:strand:+ start:1165 stop:1497 length:333 start_codon:yes stop_codon:yes gene_type:complete
MRYRHPEILMWATPNSGKMKPQHGVERKALGVLAGVADLAVIVGSGTKSLPPKMVFVEMKTLKGRLSPAQKVFQAQCWELGAPYYVCRSLDEFIETIEGEIKGDSDAQAG